MTATRICRPCFAVAPLAKLPHARIKHLIGVKTRILAQQRMGERRDQRFGRVTQDQMPGDKARRSIDLLSAVEGVKQSRADLLDRDGQVIEPIAALAGQRRRRHVQVAGEIERHCPVQEAAHGRDRHRRRGPLRRRSARAPDGRRWHR